MEMIITVIHKNLWITCESTVSKPWMKNSFKNVDFIVDTSKKGC